MKRNINESLLRNLREFWSIIVFIVDETESLILYYPVKKYDYILSVLS